MKTERKYGQKLRKKGQKEWTDKEVEKTEKRKGLKI